jgi:hypothetical protein
LGDADKKKPVVAVQKDSFVKSIMMRMDELSADELRAKIEKYAKEFAAIHENINPSWFKALTNEFNKPYFKNV